MSASQKIDELIGASKELYERIRSQVASKGKRHTTAKVSVDERNMIRR